MTRKEILKKYNLKDHSFKFLTKKYKIKPIKSDGYKNYYNELDFIEPIKNYTIREFWSGDEIKVLRSCYPKGGIVECLSKLDKNEKSIKYKAYSMGIYLDPKTKSNIYTNSMLNRESIKTQDDFKIRHEDLRNLKDNLVVYFLGFMWADGCIRSNRIFMTLIKEDMLNSLEEILPKYGEWNFRNDKTKYRSFNVYCKPYFDWLCGYDFHEKSSIPPTKLMDNLPKENLRYFFRGFLDGDGSFPLNKKTGNVSFSVTGPYGYDWSFFTNVLDELLVKYTIRNVCKEYSKFSEVRVNKKNDILKISKFLYGDEWDGIGLKRKYDKSIINGI
jgi:hypothetical protein